MNNNMTKGHLRLLKENYANACNAYVLALANMWDWDCKSYGSWVADDVGGKYDYGGMTYICMEDIIFCVENNISFKTFDEWDDYCLWAHKYGQAMPNLKSWVANCPRVAKETRDKLTKAKAELNALIEEAKKSTGKQKK